MDYSDFTEKLYALTFVGNNASFLKVYHDQIVPNQSTVFAFRQGSTTVGTPYELTTLNSLTFNVQNLMTGARAGGPLQLSSNFGEFSLSSNGCTGGSIPGNGSCNFLLVFNASGLSAGTYIATLTYGDAVMKVTKTIGNTPNLVRSLGLMAAGTSDYYYQSPEVTFSQTSDGLFYRGYTPPEDRL